MRKNAQIIMHKNQRESEILDYLNEYTYVTVDYLSKKINISASSIRRDLSDMEQRGLVKRSYGGVELNNSNKRNIPFSMRIHENSSSKRKIAECAAKLIHSGDVIFLDGSSSAFFMAKELVKIKNITVFTNSLESMCFFTEYDINAYCTGGTLNNENKSALVGDYSLEIINNIHADFVFFSAQSVMPDGRIYDCYSHEITVRNCMIKNSSRSVFLCDKTKLGRSSSYYQCNACDLDYVISDADLLTFFDSIPEKTKLITA